LTYTNSNGHAKAAMSVASFINKIALKIWCLFFFSTWIWDSAILRRPVATQKSLQGISYEISTLVHALKFNYLPTMVITVIIMNVWHPCLQDAFCSYRINEYRQWRKYMHRTQNQWNAFKIDKMHQEHFIHTTLKVSDI
jgi:hypothetical protein